MTNKGLNQLQEKINCQVRNEMNHKIGNKSEEGLVNI